MVFQIGLKQRNQPCGGETAPTKKISPIVRVMVGLVGLFIVGIWGLFVYTPIICRAEIYGYETAAIGMIRTIHTAQTQYLSQFGHFATSLAQLGPPRTGQPGQQAADLIGWR